MSKNTSLETIEAADLDSATGGVSGRWLARHPYAAAGFLEHHPRRAEMFAENHPWADARMYRLTGC